MSVLHGIACCVWIAGSSPVEADPSLDRAAGDAPVDRAAGEAPVEAPEVLVIGTPVDEAAVRRVAAELEAIGLSVQVEITTEPARLESAETDDASAQRRAVVRVDTARGEAHLFVRDGTGNTTARIVERGPDDQPAPDAVLAHRTVEVLRASLRELSSAAPPAITPEPAVPTTPATTPLDAPRPEPQRHDTLLLLLGGAIAGSPGALSPTGHAALGLRWQAHPRVGVAVRGLLPVHARALSRPEGRATAWLGTAQAWVWVGLARPARRWQPDLGAGVGAVLLGVRGEATAPLRSRNELVAAATLAGGGGLSVWLHTRVRVRASGFIGAALPRPAVRFAGREVAAWGRPFGGAVLGVEIGVL